MQKACPHYPKPEQSGVRRSCEIDRKRSANSLFRFADLPPVPFRRRCEHYPLPAHIRSQPTVRCCSQMNRAFRVSSVSQLHRRLCRLHGSQDKDIRIFQTVLSLLLHGDRFEAPILRSAALHRLAAFQRVYPFFGIQPPGQHSVFAFRIRQQYCGQAAARAAYMSRLKHHRCFLLFAADGQCQTAPAHGTQSEPRALHDLSAFEASVPVRAGKTPA